MSRFGSQEISVGLALAAMPPPGPIQLLKPDPLVIGNGKLPIRILVLKDPVGWHQILFQLERHLPTNRRRMTNRNPRSHYGFLRHFDSFSGHFVWFVARFFHLGRIRWNDREHRTAAAPQ